ncbi:alpha/beta hydrolase [Ramlibacter sp. H39-3-26]|uniref:alpha/beta hydrolase n=1 Tax=Curvibacter soli TaxID=3031331 RepID=UPI0023D9BCA0|nr:alpha/beta hydrolase [Ramlibacter sp. H39-3-26]MDF1484902.1 alpha/beta hydrolase [Ramlibacter sp. H39-3-26]
MAICRLCICLPLACALAAQPAAGQDFAPREGGRRAAAAAVLPPGVRRIADLPYGPDVRQRMDVYLPSPAGGPARVPMLVMVHGGAWMIGDKTTAARLDNKLAHWVARQGWMLVSVNYRLAPQARPDEQARDVARAIAAAQAHAAQWGADADRLLLMGHSAGAHLVALLGADPARAEALGARRWRGTIALDSAALDVPALMERPHLRFYDRAFGGDPAVWRAASPIGALAAGAPPLLLVCSTTRPDDSCGQSRRFAERARALGIRAELLPQAKSHRDINDDLGAPGDYTGAVDRFVASLGL